MNNFRRRIGKSSKIVVNGVTYLDFGLPSGTYFALSPSYVYENWPTAIGHGFTIASKAQFEELIAACNLSFYSEGSGSQEKHYVDFTSKTTGAKARVYMHGYKSKSENTPSFLNVSSNLWSCTPDGTYNAYFMLVHGQTSDAVSAEVGTLSRTTSSSYQNLCGYWRVYKP